MTTLNKIAVVVLGSLLLLMGAVFYFQPRSLAGASQVNYNNYASQREVAVTTSGLLTATSTGRTWVSIQNTGNNAEWLGFGVPAEKGKGLLLNVSSTPFVLDLDHMYTGAIYAVSDNGGTASTTITIFSTNY